MVLQPYNDIKNKLGKPLWYDEKGVPRYARFDPSLVNNIYANEVALVEIWCQACKEKFLVAFSSDANYCLLENYNPISYAIFQKTLHYGDPPIHGSCGGYTMNCEDLKVVEFWRNEYFSWIRDKKLEIRLDV